MSEKDLTQRMDSCLYQEDLEEKLSRRATSGKGSRALTNQKEPPPPHDQKSEKARRCYPQCINGLSVPES